MIYTEVISFNGTNATKIVEIRTSVFVEEQNVDSSIDFDGRDAGAIHILAYSDQKPVATARMLEDGHIGRVAVLADYRQKGIGNAVMQTLIKEAKLRGFTKVFLHSQAHASDFYKKIGFKACSEVFIEAGIEHIEMKLYL